MDTTTESVVAALAADLHVAYGARFSRRPSCYTITRRHLAPHAPAGLWQWLVSPAPRESTRAYAARAVRYLVARASSAGLACSLRHGGAEHLGMLEGHVLPAGAGCALVGGL